MRPALLTFLCLAATALQACASPPPLTAKSPATRIAVETYRSCAWAAIGPLKGTGQPSPAAQLALATSAESQCATQRKAVTAAVLNENSQDTARRQSFADSYVNGLRDQIIKGMATE